MDTAKYAVIGKAIADCGLTVIEFDNQDAAIITEIIRQRDMYQAMAVKGDDARRAHLDEIVHLRALLKMADRERAMALRALAANTRELNRLITAYEPPDDPVESPAVRAVSVMQKNGIR